uniref:serum response factor-binding protein 1 n=1 Tax=Epinephelus lanceolatus TaxID=310571 RepID=UPI001444A63E|nr:serum response factor-binding protein 1 [Epinephelus lanceolatus]XP_033493098.1 serum response factor-binding protein 1 [Epinephelus lanceolatus]
MDKTEKMEPSAEEKEKEEEEEIEEEEANEEEGQDDSGDEEEDDESDDEEQEGEDIEEKEKEEEAKPQAADKTAKNIPSAVKPKAKKQDKGLNLNNEVVKMRKEVKRVRALIIRKLTRQIGALKKKKGKEMEVERNQRRAARLVEEIHAMKVLAPDLVTKTALQKTLNFEEVCKNPKSTISDRAIARIATHPQFNKKIEAIKAAVKAFKEERMKELKQGAKEKVQNKPGKGTPQLPDTKIERQSEKEEEDITVEQKEIKDIKEGDSFLKDTEDASVAEPEEETVKAAPAADTADGLREEMPESKSVRPALVKNSEVKDIVKNECPSKGAEKKPSRKPTPEVHQETKDEEESDLESSDDDDDDDDDEKEYFDDSTEERFHKQSSQSEESDDDGGFFLGKVSKFKKKKKQKSEEEEKAEKADQVPSELDELESRLKSKTTSLQTVFCSSLSASKPGGGRGAGRGRGGDRFRGQGKPRGGGGQSRDFSKQSKFQTQEKGAQRSPGSKYSKPCPEGRHPESPEKGFSSVGRGRGRGRGGVIRQNDRRGGGVFSQQAPQQALHPSWEASKKRKEQQGQILAFQGKKIKFDDDD